MFKKILLTALILSFAACGKTDTESSQESKLTQTHHPRLLQCVYVYGPRPQTEANGRLKRVTTTHYEGRVARWQDLCPKTRNDGGHSWKLIAGSD